ncbi:MAG: hypothetical protein KME26_22580 [Oscillatoria princeps RMCB-10]|jgi:hypothetical protein|nr:hypothetical protein [Oscillatoria princeps RMCB-10]
MENVKEWGAFCAAERTLQPTAPSRKLTKTGYRRALGVSKRLSGDGIRLIEVKVNRLLCELTAQHKRKPKSSHPV